MSIETIVQELTEELERPDLTKKLENFVPQALRQAHGTKCFSRDIGKIVLTDFTIDSAGIVQVPLPKLRKIISLRFFRQVLEGGTLVNEITPVHEYVNGNDLNTEYDYYGIKISHTFTIMGGELVLTAVPTDAKAIEVKALVWTKIDRYQVTDALTTDSWIAEEFPEYIKSILRAKIAFIIDKNALLQFANSELTVVRKDFINSQIGAFE